MASKSGIHSTVRRRSALHLPRDHSQRPLLNRIDLGGHAISMTVFGFAGYLAYKWDIRAGELLAARRAEIATRRGQTVEES